MLLYYITYLNYVFKRKLFFRYTSYYITEVNLEHCLRNAYTYQLTTWSRNK